MKKLMNLLNKIWETKLKYIVILCFIALIIAMIHFGIDAPAGGGNG